MPGYLSVANGNQICLGRPLGRGPSRVGLCDRAWRGARRLVPQGSPVRDGRIHARYLLRETPPANYLQRTEQNVRDSDATVASVSAVSFLPPSRNGTTNSAAIRHKSPTRCTESAN